MKYLLFCIRGFPHFYYGAQILTMDDKLHTDKVMVFYKKTPHLSKYFLKKHLKASIIS